MNIEITAPNHQNQWIAEYRYFLLSLISLLVIGHFMVFSASYMFAKEQFGSSWFFSIRQFYFLLIGSIGAYALSKTKFSFWIRYGFFVHGFFALLVFATLIPGVATVIKGSGRWLNLAGVVVQPGEILKYTTLLASVSFFKNFVDWSRNQKIIYSLTLLSPIMALVFQPDFGMFVLCLVNLFFVCYLSPFPRKIFYGLVTSSAISCGFILLAAPYRVQRILSYLDPWNDPKGTGFQIIQSFLAFANGAIFGAGLGNSNEKLFYLPEAHNDFIFSVIGEELGFVGVLLVVAIFYLFCFYGLKMAMKITDSSRAIFATAAIFSISFQAFLNMSVVMGLLPTKGLTLPFISYGGSSLVSNLLVVGLFISCLKAKDSEQRQSVNMVASEKESDAYSETESPYAVE